MNMWERFAKKLTIILSSQGLFIEFVSLGPTPLRHYLNPPDLFS
ncbi:MAG: hypothetical protein FD188_3519, partial [Ignavibacteria bacterium]